MVVGFLGMTYHPAATEWGQELEKNIHIAKTERSGLCMSYFSPIRQCITSPNIPLKIMHITKFYFNKSPTCISIYVSLYPTCQ